MKLSLTTKQAGKLRLALHIAIDSEDALIDAHTSNLTGKEYDKPVCNKTRANIRAFRKIIQKIDNLSAKESRQ